MNILHVLSGDFVSGAETYAAALIDEQMRRGHNVFIASGSFSQPTGARFIVLPIYQRNYIRRVRNVLTLLRLIRREGIDIIHAHSRAACWVSHWAAKFTNTAFVTTLHGRLHRRRSLLAYNVYGNTCIAVCEKIRDQLLSETASLRPEQVVVIRNGIRL